MKVWGPTLCLLTGASLLLAACTLTVPAGNQSSSQSPGQSPLEQPVSSLPASTPADAAADAAADAPADAPEAQPTASVAGTPGDLLNSVLDDAAQRTGVASDALLVTRADATTWPDGSLGCPEPGMFYTQALVDGYWIVVESEDQTLDYRVQDTGFFRLCEQNLPRGGNTP